MSMPQDPVSRVQWVPAEKVEPNSYNPNRVAPNELHLLYLSILHDGFTQPVVTTYDPERDRYTIIDGFHRYHVLRTYADIAERTGGLLPVVVLEGKSENERMAATVRHNRARGKHALSGMANMVFAMLEKGWPDSRICNELGLEVEELVRLKHVTGFSKLYENAEYNLAWETAGQVSRRVEHEKRQTEETAPGGDQTLLEEPEGQ